MDDVSFLKVYKTKRFNIIPSKNTFEKFKTKVSTGEIETLNLNNFEELNFQNVWPDYFTEIPLNLKKLKIRLPNIEDSSNAKRIFESLEKNISIESFKFSSEGKTKEYIKSIQKMINLNTNLHSLILDFSGDFDSFFKEINENQTLKKLELYTGILIDCNFLKKLPNLTFLQLTDQFNGEIQEIFQYCPNLEYLSVNLSYDTAISFFDASKSKINSLVLEGEISLQSLENLMKVVNTIPTLTNLNIIYLSLDVDEDESGNFLNDLFAKNQLKSLSISDIFTKYYNRDYYFEFLKNLDSLEEIIICLDGSLENDLKNYGIALRSLKNLRRFSLEFDENVQASLFMSELEYLSQIVDFQISFGVINEDKINFLLKFLKNNLNLRSLNITYDIRKDNLSGKIIDAIVSHPNLKHFISNYSNFLSTKFITQLIEKSKLEWITIKETVVFSYTEYTDLKKAFIENYYLKSIEFKDLIITGFGYQSASKIFQKMIKNIEIFNNSLIHYIIDNEGFLCEKNYILSKIKYEFQKRTSELNNIHFFFY